ncbi:MAG: ABC transporter permease [Gammaproteobacteria bacterium]|nr:ABC transporter permease [Gammaproteobacteria bacterium]
MFIAIRDLTFAKGRFLLMGLVVALVAFLVTILSGTSAGLIKNNISGLIELPATHLAFEYNERPSYRNTMVERYMWEGWQGSPGVKAMEPMGHTVFNARTQRDEPLEIVLWGLRPGSFIEPKVAEGEQLGPMEDGVIISRLLADDGVKIGDTIILDRVLTELKVIGILDEERNIGHMPIIYTPLPKWQEATYGPPGGSPPGEKLPDILFDFVSMLALQLEEGVDVVPLDDAFETATLDREEFYAASTGYTEEVMSVGMIQLFLVIVSAVVIGAFFTIWTIQRTKEIGLVKALGASSWYLMKDALGQALLLMLVSTAVGLGLAIAIGKGLIEGTAFPFMFEGGMVASSMLLLIVAGLIGAAFAIRQINAVDAMIALGREQ